MTWTNTDKRYGSLMIGLHWFMMGLIVIVYALILLREAYPRGSDPREMLKAWHFTLGVAVFGLAWLRLALSLVQVHPRVEPNLVPSSTRLPIIRLSEPSLIRCARPGGGSPGTCSATPERPTTRRTEAAFIAATMFRAATVIRSGGEPLVCPSAMRIPSCPRTARSTAAGSVTSPCST